MLLVHPSSQCDVCLDPYTWATPAKAPHAIQCGHVFCLDCLRSVSPTNCPLCRKGFNPERIKKLHVDKVNGDGSGLAGPMQEEYEFFKRIAALFDHHSDPADINALVEEVNAWVLRPTRPSEATSEDHPLRIAVTALHQYRALQIEKDETKKELSKLRATHERHVTLKDSDLKKAMVVERNMLQERQEAERELQALRAENTRLQDELKRYTHPSNPLPRPPELNPIISSMTRQLALPPTQGTSANLPPGFVPSGAAIPAGEPQLQPTTAAQPTETLQVIPPEPTAAERSKYRVTSTGEQLRSEKRRRSHLIVPGASYEVRVIPLQMDADATPRASAVVPPTSQGLSMWAGEDWPFDYPDPRPRPGEPAAWANPRDGRAKVPNQVLMADLPPAPAPATRFVPVPSRPPAGQPRQPPAGTAVELPIPDIPYLTRSARIRVDAPDGPMAGHQPLDWRSGPAHKKGYVPAYDPIKGIHWMHESKAAKLPVRARGTHSHYPYAIAKEPSELDERWGSGASPGPNPLQLTGVPESVVAGPSNIPREDKEAPFHTAREGSTLFQTHPVVSGRAASGSVQDAAGPSAAAENSLSGLLGFGSSTQRGAGDLLGLGHSAQQEPGQSTTARPPVQSQPPAEQLPQPSPASSWGGTYQPSRRSSLSLQLNNLPSPHGSQGASDSVEQVSITEFFGSGPVSVDVVTDNAAISFRSDGSRDGQLPGLLMSTSSREASSRQVVTGLQDLEDINRSLRQVAAEPVASDARSTRSSASASASSRPSRQSRQASASGHDPDAHVGLRTGIALYGSRVAIQQSVQRSAVDPSPAQAPPPAPVPASHTRSQSRASIGSRAESTLSHSTSASGSGSSQRSSGHPRHRRASTASGVHFHDQIEAPPAFWAAEPQDTHAYTSHGPYADQPPRGSQESIPRSLGSIGGDFGGAGGGLLLSFEAPSTSSAVDRNGEAAAGIHAPRPVSSRHSTRSLFGGAWNARSGR